MKKKIIFTTIFFIILLFVFVNTLYAKSENFGNWKYYTEQNPIYEGIDLKIFGLSHKPKSRHVLSLELGSEGYYILMFKRHEKLKEGNYKLVYKFDDGDIYEGHWNQLSPHQFEFTAGFDKFKNFLINMLNSKELYFGHRLENRPMETTTFKLDNFNKTIEPYLDDFGLESIKNK